MPRPQRRLWVCPLCDDGVLAPSRMRKNDVRRFCLACSKTTGRLVERTSPALERQRAAAKAKRAERAEREREQKRQRWIVRLTDARGRERELDVRAELRRALTDMGFFDGWAYGQKPTVDDLNITIRRGSKGHHTGRASIAGFDVTFTFGTDGYEAGMKLIYHEAAHMASPYGQRRAGGKTDAHGMAFHRILADALQKRWPWIVYGSLAPNQRGGCYEMGRRIAAQMRDHVARGGEL